VTCGPQKPRSRAGLAACLRAATHAQRCGPQVWKGAVFVSTHATHYRYIHVAGSKGREEVTPQRTSGETVGTTERSAENRGGGGESRSVDSRAGKEWLECRPSPPALPLPGRLCVSESRRRLPPLFSRLVCRCLCACGPQPLVAGRVVIRPASYVSFFSAGRREEGGRKLRGRKCVADGRDVREASTERWRRAKGNIKNPR
jgi:hypothetical protein